MLVRFSNPANRVLAVAVISVTSLVDAGCDADHLGSDMNGSVVFESVTAKAGLEFENPAPQRGHPDHCNWSVRYVAGAAAAEVVDGGTD